MKSEVGAINILLLAAIIVIIGILALVVDVSRYQTEERNAQLVSDSLSLAAAEELDGSFEGWVNVKKAVLATLRQIKSIHGYKGPKDDEGNIDWSGFSYNTGHVDYYYQGPNYEYNQGELGNLSVKVERGTFWEDPAIEDRIAFRFISFDTETSLGGHDLATLESSFGGQLYVMANAVQVDVSVGGVDTAFGGYFDVDKLEDVTGASVAIADSAIEECVFPIAIPLCQVMRDLKLTTGINAITDGYKSDKQCHREVMAMEADAENNQYRMEGLTRAYSYTRPPMTMMNGSPNDCFPPVNGNLPAYTAGIYPNCKATPIKATLGIPRSADPTKIGDVPPRELNELINALDLSTPPEDWCMPARMGTIFRPMQTAVDGAGHPLRATGETPCANCTDGFLQPATGASALEDRLVDIINGGERDLSDALEWGSNYPYNRGIYSGGQFPESFREALISFPVEDDPYAGFIVARNKWIPNTQNYINPACHTAGLAPKVKEVNLMVVVPGDGSSNYCNNSSYFTAPSTAHIVDFDSDPTVVGFIKAYLFDFHIRKHLDDTNVPASFTFDSEVNDPNTFTDQAEWDSNPYGLYDPGITNTVQETFDDISGILQSFFEDHDEWENCDHDCEQCSPNGCDEEGTDDDTSDDCDIIPCQHQQCPDCNYDEPTADIGWGDEIDLNAPPELADCLNIQSFYGKKFEDCWLGEAGADAPGEEFDPDDLIDDGDDQGFGKKGEWKKFKECLDATSGNLSDEIIPIFPEKACLPYKIQGSDYNPADPSSWEVRHMQPQYLCGGLRLRLDCKDENIIGPAREEDESRRPIHVKAGL